MRPKGPTQALKVMLGNSKKRPLVRRVGSRLSSWEFAARSLAIKDRLLTDPLAAVDFRSDRHLGMESGEHVIAPIRFGQRRCSGSQRA